MADHIELPASEHPLPADLFDGLSIYQDVVLAGQTVLDGARECQGRWQAIQPHLPPLRTALDVGSNFGWFSLQLANHNPDVVVASVEADERSAAVQRRVLASHDTRRIVLLTQPAGAPMARRFAEASTRFDAVLCLAVLHWMRDHRQFLDSLRRIAGRIFIEQPDPREAGAGVERYRREIGEIGPYLYEMFPDRTVRQIAELPNDRESPYPRQLWLVEQPTGWQPAQGLDVAALADLAPSWPPRQWWVSNAEWGMGNGECQRLLFAANGLGWTPVCDRATNGKKLRRQLERLPEGALFTRRQRWTRRARRLAAGLARRVGLPR